MQVRQLPKCFVPIFALFHPDHQALGTGRTEFAPPLSEIEDLPDTAALGHQIVAPSGNQC